jgi:transcriptional regulator with GAF, ATPase, and Fis domain
MSVSEDLWREACQHVDLRESIGAVARIVGGVAPARCLLVRRLDPSRGGIATVAAGVCHAGAELPRSATTTCDGPQARRLLDWSTGDVVWRRGAGPAWPFEAVLPEGLGPEDALVAPLRGEQGPDGFVVLVAQPSGVFEPAHESLARELAAPLAVALWNHLRLLDLAQAREALEADNRALLSRLDRHSVSDVIVGEGAGLRGVMERVTQVAPTDAPVLLLGETGSGKEVIARAIHARSRRAQGPIVRVNCGALPAGLIDSELFGHERGSFTGALATRRGWFERADGGTLFLDEVGELPLDAQVRLLRILQDGTLERMGAEKSLTVDVRIVAATHRDLREMVAAGGFREDLWYRISVFPIEIPPLRERLEDLPLLAGHFASRTGRRLNGVPLYPSAADMEVLLRYPWPGNVRELSAVIERAAILGDGKALRLDMALGGAPAASALAADRAPAPRDEDYDLDRAMARHIERVLAVTRGRIEGPHGAAALLGINPHTLRARMRKLGVAWAKYRTGGSTAGRTGQSNGR